jgi:hypothetical protein
MKRLLTLIVGVALVLATAGLAQAGPADKAGNILINATLGWIDCPKAWADEVSRGGGRGVAGVFVTGPLMCGANLGARYVGVAADVLTLPLGDNLVKPNALDGKPPLRLP